MEAAGTEAAHEGEKSSDGDNLMGKDEEGARLSSTLSAFGFPFQPPRRYGRVTTSLGVISRGQKAEQPVLPMFAQSITPDWPLSRSAVTLALPPPLEPNIRAM
jgi:hypothetical protein